MALTDRLKELRVKKGVSKRELSFALGLTETSYGKYEAGKRLPSLNVLLRMSEYFNVPVDYILDRSSNQDMGLEAFGLTRSIDELDADEQAYIKASIKSAIDTIKFMKNKQKNDEVI